MSISQIFVLSLRGDTIITKNFRKELKKGTNEIFFRKVNLDSQSEEVPPIFNIDGINFIHIKKNNLYFVITSLENLSPCFFFEALERIINIIKDHIGEISEEAIRKNFVIIYEILDEMIDCGIPQLSTTEQIKPFVCTEPVILMKNKNINTIKEIFNKNVKSNESTKKSVANINSKSKNEIFVDLLEKLTVLFNSSGKLINSSIDGCIKMKSYLKGNPELRIQFNDDIIIGHGSTYTDRATIEDCNFYPTVQTKDLEINKTLFVIPPEGEFILMNYRVNTEFTPPFKFFAFIEEKDYKLEMNLKLMANFTDKFFAGNILVKFNIPKSAQTIYLDVPQKNKLVQKYDYIQNEHICYWKIPKIQGGAENNLDVRITLQGNNPHECRKELGPITLTFDLPNFNISRLQIKELKVLTNDKNYNALRWVRIITQSNSYVARIA